MATNTTIKLKKSSVPSQAPGTGDLDYGEIAINYADGRLYYKNSSNVIKNFVDSDIIYSVLSAGIADGTADFLDSGSIRLLIDSDYIKTWGWDSSDFNTILSQKTTDNLAEGSTNLYYAKYRVDSDIVADVTKAFVDGLSVDAATLGSQLPSYYLDYNNFTNTPAANSIDSDKIRNIFSVTGQLTYDSATGQFGTFGLYSASSFDSDFTLKTTTDLTEGSNLYYTSVRVDSDITAAVTKSFVDALTIDGLYYTANFDSDFTAGIAGLTTNDLTEGDSNLYYTTGRVQTDIIATVNKAFVDALSVNATQLNSQSANYYLDYTNFLNTPNVLDSENVRNIFSVTGALTYDSATGQFGTTGLYTSSSFDTDFGNKSTSDLTEGTNLYYTQARIDSDLADGHISSLKIGNNATFSWNSTDNTVDIQYEGRGVTLQVGQEQHMYVTATGIIPDGSLVMVDSAGNDTIWVTLCDPDVVGFTSEKIIGITTQNFNSDEAGYITIYGKVRGIDTSMWNEGDFLYMDPTTPGGLTNVKPTPPNTVQQIAIVTKSDGINGTIQVRQEHLPDTNDIVEGSTNLYYTTARFDSDLGTKTTDDLAQGSTNRYFSNTLARNALSVVDAGGDGSFAYDSATGQFTYTGPSASETRAHFSAGTGVTLSSGQISIGQDVATTADVTFNSVTFDSSSVHGEQYGGIAINTSIQLGDSSQSVLNYTSNDSSRDAVFTIGKQNLFHHAIGVTGNGTANELIIGADDGITTIKIKKNLGSAPFNLSGGDDIITITPSGNTTYASATEATTKTNASVVLTGGLGVDKTIRANDIIVVNNVTAGTNGTGKFIGNVTGTVSSLSNHTTTALAEGTNKYYTTARFDSDLGASTTDDLPQGSTNKYYDSATTTATARHAISVNDTGGDGSVTYNATTGVLTYSGPTATDVRAHFSAGTGVTLTNGQISIGQAVGTNDSVQFSGMTVLNNVVIEGDLYVAGTQTTVSQSTLSVNSSFIHVADSNTDDVVDIGIIGHYSDDGGITSRHTGFIRDATNGEWYVFDGLIQDTLDSSPPATTINVNGPGWNLPTWNFGKLRGQYLGFDSDFTAYSTNYTVYDSDFTAVTAGRYAVDTTNGQVQCTLPINPTTGDYVKLIDVSNWSGTNTVLVNRNGATIEGYADNFELDLGQSIVEFIYINNTWNIYSSIGQRGPQGPKGDSADPGTFATNSQAIAFAIALG